jgi:cytidylate kinase
MPMNPKGLMIAIDGPSGAGKSTAAKEVARELGYIYIDTGAMYRAVGLKAWRKDPTLQKADEIVSVAAGSIIELRNEEGKFQIYLDGENVSEEIRREEISQAASIVSSIPGVRRILVKAQQEMGKQGGVVMEGRDIGTEVFPQAELKVFLDASDLTRARRRYEENLRRGVTLSLEQTIAEINERDRRDSEREDSPLVRAKDAIYLDTSPLPQEVVIREVLRLTREKLHSMGIKKTL